jgi:hypothetical protein
MSSLFSLAFFGLMLASFWQIFIKAGREGWEGLVPIYNIYLFIQLVGKPGWWIFLLLIPVVNLVIIVLISLEVAKCFGKPAPFAIGLLLLPFVFYPILAFTDAEYSRPLATNY